jgi:hypothetical protein
MNDPEVLWEGPVTGEQSTLESIVAAIKKLVGRKGRLLWVDAN